jgi:hypothetical protein
MADKARHAFGSLEGVDSALLAGKIDSHDILFVKNADGKPFVGWIDKDGNKVIVDNSAEMAALEDAIATKVGAEEIEALENQIATKVDAEAVQTMIEKHSESIIEVVEF